MQEITRKIMKYIFSGFLLAVPLLATAQFGEKRDSLDYYKYLAQAEYDMVADYESSVYYATKAIHLDPRDFELYELRAVARNFQGDYEGMENDLSIVLQLNPNNFAAYDGRAYARVKLKKYREAIQDFDFLIQTEPTFGGYYVERGFIRLQLKELDAACEDFRRANILGSIPGYQALMDHCYR